MYAMSARRALRCSGATASEQSARSITCALPVGRRTSGRQARMQTFAMLHVREDMREAGTVTWSQVREGRRET